MLYRLAPHYETETVLMLTLTLVKNKKNYLVTVLSLEVLNGHHAGHHPDGNASVLVVYPSNRDME